MKREGRLFAVVKGASSGIGFELAKVFARNNYDLVICAEDERLQQATTVLSDMTEVQAVQADLAEYESATALERCRGYQAKIGCHRHQRRSWCWREICGDRLGRGAEPHTTH